MKSLADESERGRTIARIELLRPESVRQWVQMTSHQMICHLNDSYLTGLNERKTSLASGPLDTTVIKWCALYLPIKWPKGVATRPEVEQGRGGTPPLDFAEDRRKLIETIGRFCAASDRLKEAVHPIFGAMSARDWLRWGYLHPDHHLRQFGL